MYVLFQKYEIRWNSKPLKIKLASLLFLVFLISDLRFRNRLR